MEEIFPSLGSLNGTHAQQAMTDEEQEDDDFWFINAYVGLCDRDDHRAVHRPHVLRRFQTMRRARSPLYDGVLQPRIKELGISWPEFDRKVQQFVDPDTIPVTLPHVTAPLMPSLPLTVQHDETMAAQASPWLDDYVAHSQRWAPRAAAGFHEAIGLWVLSTMAAGRLCVDMGSSIYPVLFLSLIAPSTMYTKTTTIKIGLKAIEACGCKHLLAADRTSPQALLRAMSGRVPADFGDLDIDAQERLRRKLAFAGQCGWRFDEWGEMLTQIIRPDSPMAAFHGLLRVLDDSNEDFSSDTVSRGLEYISAPYLALLASATPPDLQQFTKPGSRWWRDGFWARFTFITPQVDEPPNRRRRPSGLAQVPSHLIADLHAWHHRLGIPTAVIEPALDAKGKPTGGWRRQPVVLPVQHFPIDPDAEEAYYAYNDALHDLTIQHRVPDDFVASYGRFHDKALRVALLLASLDQAPSLSMKYWWRGQAIAEQWRGMLHHVVQLVEQSLPMTREQQLEMRIMDLAQQMGTITRRDCCRKLHMSAKEVAPLLKALVDVGELLEYPDKQGVHYGIPVVIDEDNAVASQHADEDVDTQVPF